MGGVGECYHFGFVSWSRGGSGRTIVKASRPDAASLLHSTSPNAKLTRIDKVLAALLLLALARVKYMRQMIFTNRFA